VYDDEHIIIHMYKACIYLFIQTLQDIAFEFILRVDIPETGHHLFSRCFTLYFLFVCRNIFLS